MTKLATTKGPVLGLLLSGLMFSAVQAAPPKEAAAPPTVKSFRAPYPAFGTIERVDPALDEIIAPGTKPEMLAEGFDWSEGPVWVKKEKSLLFSDIPPNTIYRWTEGKGITVFMRPAVKDAPNNLKEPGTNGLTIDRKGQLVMCQHGARRLARLDSWSNPGAGQTAVVDRFEGKRLNSPNDLIIGPKGDIYFTDPPYGLSREENAPEKELPFQGVYRVDPQGKVQVVYKEFARPNGIALSPDAKILYVGSSAAAQPVIMAFDLQADGSVGAGRLFFDGKTLYKEGRTGGFDGMTVDQKGNVFATGPGGVVIISKAGKHLGTIVTGQATANCKFGEDGKSLFITADPVLGRVRTKTKGIGF